MSWNQIELRSLSYTDSSSSTYGQLNMVNRPVEIYAFIDPLCPKCWSLEAYFKKLSIEYGQYITIRPIISKHLSVLTNHQLLNVQKMQQSSHDNIHLKMEQSNEKQLVLFPWIALAIKAAELQGKNAGRMFLRKIQEKFFWEKKNISNESVLIHCAEEANLDVQEFKNDLFSTSAKNAYQCDLKITKDMGVYSSPTLVLFNQTTVEQGIKMAGIYTYTTYIQILKGLLKKELRPAKHTSLQEFLAHYQITTSQEVSIVFDLPVSKAIQELKKLQIKRKAIEVKMESTTYWKYNNNEERKSR